MTKREWIRQNRDLLDAHIQAVSPDAPKNDRERELWLLNDYGLYCWAKSEGVKL